MTLIWDPPHYEMQNGLIRHYNVEILVRETGAFLFFNTSSTNITANNLLPFYSYNCSVSAETVAAGPSSSIITFDLPEGREFYLSEFSTMCF